MIPVRTIRISSVSTSVRYSPPARQWLWSSIQPCRTCREAPTVRRRSKADSPPPMPGFRKSSRSVAAASPSKVIRSNRFAYTTDAVIIRNTNANAILAVYPFTGEPVITQALLTVAQMPLFVGVGGGTTTGPRVAELAMVAEMQGAAGVVINAPAPAETIETTMSMVDIPVIATVTEDDEITECKILAGAAIINVAAGARTAQVVASIRAHHPEIPILASGGGREDRILATIDAGARRDHMDAAKRATTAVADDGQIPWRSLSGSYNPTNQYQKPAVETSLPSQAFGYCKASSIVRNRSDGCASNGSSNVTSILFGEVSDSRVQSQEYCALCDRATG